MGSQNDKQKNEAMGVPKNQKAKRSAPKRCAVGNIIRGKCSSRAQILAV